MKNGSSNLELILDGEEPSLLMENSHLLIPIIYGGTATGTHQLSYKSVKDSIKENILFMFMVVKIAVMELSMSDSKEVAAINLFH